MRYNHKYLLAAAGLLLATQVQAAPGCNASNLNGNYVLYQAAINHHNHNGKCTISINSGVVSGNCAFGYNAAGEPGFSGAVYSPGIAKTVGNPGNELSTTGVAVINQNCSAIIPMSFDPAPGIVHIDSVFEVQFTPDKKSFIGRFSNTFGVEGITNGTRYSPALPATPAPAPAP